MMKLLEIKDVVIHYITDDGTVKAVNNVSLDLDRRSSWKDRQR